MPATEQFTITLPTELVELIRSKVASGEYVSESEYVETKLREKFDLPDTDDPELEQWLKTVGVARYDAYDANPNDVYTADEILKSLQSRLASRQKAA
jgi:antitoxin ParD1/3/4